jgi:2'-5' RNA ligase
LAAYPDAEQLANHWWWRPGWGPGTRFYTWHITVANLPGLQQLVGLYKTVLRGCPVVDLVPDEWLHITLQGVGHVHDVSDDERDDMVRAVRERLAKLPAAPITFHEAVLHREAVVVPPTDPKPLAAIRSAIREGIADVWGEDRVPESDVTFRPHVSAAYVNSASDPAPVRAALDQVHAEPVMVTIEAASLIVLNRDHRNYEWDSAILANVGERLNGGSGCETGARI